MLVIPYALSSTPFPVELTPLARSAFPSPLLLQLRCLQSRSIYSYSFSYHSSFYSSNTPFSAAFYSSSPYAAASSLPPASTPITPTTITWTCLYIYITSNPRFPSSPLLFFLLLPLHLHFAHQLPFVLILQILILHLLPFLSSSSAVYSLDQSSSRAVRSVTQIES